MLPITEMIVFPVICKDSLWQEIPWLAKLQARPRDGRALASFRGNSLDVELVKIAKEILEITQNGAPRPQPQGSADPSKLPILAALHQLPTPPADFTGRQEDLDFLRSNLAQGGTGAIFGLRGIGGVGKTSLALKLAEELKPRFPDAQLYLDLKGVDPHPLTPAQALTHAIRAFHPETRLPESEAELAVLYRSVLDGKRVLLLMDNAARKEQVEPLIPPSTCLLLVTSRFHFALPGLVDRDLDKMPERDAKDLLLRIAPRIGDAADEIAFLCGRLPLALRLAGSALAERPDLSPAQYARRFKEGKEKLEPVEASVRTSYDLLTEERRRLWRLLAVFPETFDAEAAAAVWPLEIDDARDHLGELVRSSLVEWEDKDERYWLHDLARVFANKNIKTAERGESHRRHAEHFLEVLSLADSFYEQGGENSRLGLDLFDREWSNVRAGQAWAATQFSNDKEAADLCSNYPNVGAYVLALRQHPRERIQWREVALAAARHSQDRAAEGYHLGNLGPAYADLGEPRHAIEFFEQHLTIAREIGDRMGEGTALGNLGNAYADLDEPQRAIEFYEQYLTIAREIGDRIGEGNALLNLGLVYADLGEPRRAVKFYDQALIIDRETGDRYGESNALGSLGNAYAALGEPQCAIEFFEQHLTIAREIGDRRGEGNSSWNLGLVLEGEGDLTRAADLMQVCVDYEIEIGHSAVEQHAAYVEALRARIADAARD